MPLELTGKFPVFINGTRNTSRRRSKSTKGTQRGDAEQRGEWITLNESRKHVGGDWLDTHYFTGKDQDPIDDIHFKLGIMFEAEDPCPPPDRDHIVWKYQNGDMYLGQWRIDNDDEDKVKEHGFGFMWNNGPPCLKGLIYYGEWFCGVCHGRGRSRWWELSKIWHDKKPLKDTPVVDGQLYFYRGRYEIDDKKDEKAIVTLQDGNSYQGPWKDGIPVNWDMHTRIRTPNRLTPLFSSYVEGDKPEDQSKTKTGAARQLQRTETETSSECASMFAAGRMRKRSDLDTSIPGRDDKRKKDDTDSELSIDNDVDLAQVTPTKCTSNAKVENTEDGDDESEIATWLIRMFQVTSLAGRARMREYATAFLQEDFFSVATIQAALRNQSLTEKELGFMKEWQRKFFLREAATIMTDD